MIIMAKSRKGDFAINNTMILVIAVFAAFLFLVLIAQRAGATNAETKGTDCNYRERLLVCQNVFVQKLDFLSQAQAYNQKCPRNPIDTSDQTKFENLCKTFGIKS
jgi:hypothetical protein